MTPVRFPNLLQGRNELMGGTMNTNAAYKIKYLTFLGMFLIVDSVIFVAKEKNKNK